MQQDFKAALMASKKTPTTAHWLGILASVAVVGTILFLVANNAKATRNDISIAQGLSEDANTTASRITVPLSIPHQPNNKPEAETSVAIPPTKIDWSTVRVKNGDSLALIFARQGLKPQELYRLMRAGKETAALKHLTPGQQFRFHIENNSLQQMAYEIGQHKTLHAKRNTSNGFSVQTETRQLETRITNASGVIDSSLFLAGHKSGLSDNLIMELAGIFGWDIDFALDIRSGDHFTVVYEELFLDGLKQSDGNIIAAEFVNRGKTYRALRYTDASKRSDYYSTDGNSMRKAFIRTPVDFTRISSRFGKRKHPILKKWKNHHGVDYVAPRGTPIKAAGDGKIVHRGRKGGYGKTVIIQHGGSYSTLYAHMSSYSRGQRRGKHVRQGQIIGYVGTTGRSTGPHLHYEFRVNGVHRNPLTVRLPDAAPIQAKYRKDFQAKSHGLIALLDILQRTNIALNEQPNGQ